MSCSGCFAGHIKTSDPRGHAKTIHGRLTYVSQPNDPTSIKGIVVIVPDAFGWEFVNNRQLADHYASMGNFKVYLPDFMDNSAAPPW